MRIKEVCERIGLTKVRCERCGKTHNALPLIRALFLEIIMQCKDGNKVLIDGFGVFGAQIKKGRLHKTPLMKGGEIYYADRKYLKFRQSTNVKRIMKKG